MFTVNGKELEYDVFDADKMEVYEAAMQRVMDKMDELKQKEEELSASQSIREQCSAVAECFDSLFGAGTASELFDGRVNLKLALQAFGELVEGINRQRAELEAVTKSILPSGKGNRAERRAVKKK